jgi:acyl-CoA dehydrogenase
MLKSIPIHPTIELESLKDFVQKNVMPMAQHRHLNSIFDKDLYDRLHKEGWLTCALPQDLGGMSLGTSDLIWFIKELAYGSAGVATTVMANILGYSPVVLYGSTELKEFIFKTNSPKASLWGFAMTEASVGFDVFHTQTTAEKVKDGYIINGKKNYITNASVADHMCVFANVIEDGKSLGISCFYVPTVASGYKVIKVMNKLGHRESNTADILLENIFIPHRNLLGKHGDGIKILHHCLGRTKTLISAIASGLCKRSFELAAEHLSSRIQNGKSLMDKPVLQQFFAQSHTEIEAAWLLTCLAAAHWDAGSLAIKESSMAKMYASDLCVKWVAEALEFIGAQGYSDDHEISRLYRDAKLLEIYEGSTQILEILIAKEIFRKTGNEINLKTVKVA